MTTVANQLCISSSVPIYRPEPVQFRSPFRQLAMTHRAQPTLHLPLHILQLAPLRRRSPLVELQPLQNITPHLEQPFPILPRNLGDPPPATPPESQSPSPDPPPK